MIREHLFHKRAPADPLFRWRGGEVSRLEAFSDAVFAVTLTLLIVSGTPPKNFDDLWLTFRDLPVFLVSFAMLMMAWYYYYQFFRRTLRWCQHRGTGIKKDSILALGWRLMREG